MNGFYPSAFGSGIYPSNGEAPRTGSPTRSMVLSTFRWCPLTPMSPVKIISHGHAHRTVCLSRGQLPQHSTPPLQGDFSSLNFLILVFHTTCVLKILLKARLDLKTQDPGRHLSGWPWNSLEGEWLLAQTSPPQDCYHRE